MAAVFGWPRHLLEGNTDESRFWREQVDPWWSQRLGKPITPRWALQQWGTEVCRKGFHDDIWIASLENKLRTTRDNIVISDVRFPNEIKAIHNAGGQVVRVIRGEDPEWYQDAWNVNQGPTNMSGAVSKLNMERRKIHASETAWVGTKFDAVLTNDGTIDDLMSKVKDLVQDPLASTESLPYVTLSDN